MTNRRNFLKVSAIGGAALLGKPSFAQSPQNQAWEDSADVVIVGFGGAGATTAIQSARNGMSVIVLEKNPENQHISNTRMSGGGINCPDKSGDRSALKEYAKALFSGENIPGKEEGENPQYSDELAEVWADLCPKVYDFLHSCDPEFIAGKHPGYDKASFPDFPGAKESKYTSFRATYAKRMKTYNQKSYGLPKGETSSGESLWLCLENGVKQEGNKIKVLYSTPGEMLIKNPNGDVIGVVAKRNGKSIRIRAKKAVVLASGGYEYNKEMRQAFLEGPGVEGWAFYGTTSNTGDGIAMGLAAGAGLQKVGKAAARIIVPAAERFNGMRLGVMTPTVGAPHSIVVDNYGKRYEAETRVTDNPSRYFFYKAAVQFDIVHLNYPRTPSWMIFDESLKASRPLVNRGISTVGYDMVEWDEKNDIPVQKGVVLKADTIPELAEKIKRTADNQGRMISQNLVETVERFNNFCSKKEDEDFGRRAATLAPIEKGPFYAMPLVAGGPNTKGGLACNGKREVVDWKGAPIPHLYTVGEISSALKFVYQGGGNLSECIVYGQHAANQIAKLKDSSES